LFRILFALQAFTLLVNMKVLLHLQGNAGNIVQKLLIIFAGVAFMATRPVQRGVVVLIGAILAMTFICALGNDFPGFEWRLYIGGAVSVVAPFIFLTAEPNSKDRQFGLAIFAWLPLLMTLVGVVYQLAGISTLFNPDPQAGMRLSGSQGPAYLAAACFTGCFATLELAERRHIGYVWLLIANFAILVLSGGRMALAAALLICGIDYLRSFKRFPLTKFFIPIWVLICGATVLLLFAQRNLRHLETTTLSNRDLIWAAMKRHLHAHPWFGVGLGNQQLLVPESLTGRVSTIASHNEYLRVAVELGYPGAVLFFLLTLGIFLVVWNSAWVKRDPMFLVCAAAFYIFGLTDNTFSVPQAFFIMTAASFAGRGPSGLAAAQRHPFEPSAVPSYVRTPGA
jgi:O-antigen ligase